MAKMTAIYKIPADIAAFEKHYIDIHYRSKSSFEDEADAVISNDPSFKILSPGKGLLTSFLNIINGVIVWWVAD